MDRTGEELCAVVRSIEDAACLLVSLPSGRVTAVSATVAPLFGLDADRVLDRPASSLLRALWRSEPMRLLVAEAQSAFAGTTTLRVAHGELVACSVAARHMRTGASRWVFIMLSVDGVTSTGGAFLGHADEDDVVAGVGNGEGGVDDVSLNVEHLLGYDAPAFVSLSVAGLIHANDFANYLSAGSAAVSGRRTTSLRIRLRHADGTWVPVRLFLAPMGSGKRARVTFVLVRDVAPASRVAIDGSRIEEVEQRLRRIAMEIAALGITDGVSGEMAPEVAVAVGQLSPKRQEIVRRLQAGERVPTIAEELYLSQSTVRNHLSATFRQLGVSSQEELVRLLRGGTRS